jgi:acetyl esterase/lipase
LPKSAFLAVLALAAAYVATATDRPALGGTWVLDPSQSDTGAAKIKAETISISQQPEEVQLAQTVTTANGKEMVSRISCNTAGEACKVQDHGAAEVSFWYNGGMLVMSEIRGNDRMVRRRLKPSGDGHTLVMEVIHIAPAQKTETLTFTRQ